MGSVDGWEVRPGLWDHCPPVITSQINKIASLKPKTEFDKLGKLEKTIDVDAIFVLAGGLQDNGEVHEWVTSRLDLAYLIHINQKVKPKIICLGGGTYHKPPIRNEKDFVVHESTACAEYLVKRGVKPTDIYKEWGSYDTVAGVFFAYTNFILPLQLKNVMVITSEFHMPRSKAIFEWILSMIPDKPDSILYRSSPNGNMDPSILKVREGREMMSLINLQKNVISRVKTMEQFHKWFYEEHKAYCSISELIRSDDANEKEKSSY